MSTECVICGLKTSKGWPVLNRNTVYMRKPHCFSDSGCILIQKKLLKYISCMCHCGVYGNIMPIYAEMKCHVPASTDTFHQS